MWKSKKLNDTNYFLSIETENAGCLYKFCLTDFCKLWCVEKSKEQIVDQCKNINQWLEAEDEILLSETLNLFDVSRTDVRWSLNASRLLLDSTFGGIKFSFHVDFQLANEENFSKMLVSPLLLIIKNLQQQNEFLKSCLHKKDIEIAEYKLDGAVISRKNIETPIFNETLIPNSMSKESEKLLSSQTSDFVDDYIISSYNEIYSLMSARSIETQGPSQHSQSSSSVEEENESVQIREQNKIPKKKLSDSVIRVENKNGISACSIPVLDPIRKKPQPRKLKNL